MNISQVKSPNYNQRKLKIDMIVIHYTGMKTFQEALDRLCDKESKVSAHYIIDLNGDIFQLVKEDKRAWHAGVSFWDGKTDVNSRSIGIELVNKGLEFGYHDFTKEQMKSLVLLCKDILTRHDIKPENIVGHSDVAPNRKYDPGEKFNWGYLFQNGVPNFHKKD